MIETPHQGHRRRSRLAALVVAVVVTAPVTLRAAALDDLDPRTCEALDAQLAKGSAAIEIFNKASDASIAAFKAGRHDDGCRGLLSVTGWVDRMITKLDECSRRLAMSGEATRSNQDHMLRAGLAGVREDLERVDRREGCTPRS